MMLRSEGDFILASNMAQDLTNLVMQYLRLWRKHANGRSNVTVPKENFCVIFTKMKEQGYVNFKIIYTYTTYSDEPVYYDTDSDYFNESWGASNISHHVKVREDHLTEEHYSLPIRALMMPPDKMEAAIKQFVIDDQARINEINRLKRITELEKELGTLKSNDSKKS